MFWRWETVWNLLVGCSAPCASCCSVCRAQEETFLVEVLFWTVWFMVARSLDITVSINIKTSQGVAFTTVRPRVRQKLVATINRDVRRVATAVASNKSRGNTRRPRWASQNRGACGQ